MGDTIRLGGRLLKVAEMVGQGSAVLDVGTDHAYLPVWLIQNGRVNAAKASDIRIGPINRARETVCRFHLENDLKLYHCPGLSGFTEDDADTIIIAGMGGETIAGILEEAPFTKNGRHRLLLQPMTSVCDLREYLFAKGYRIRDEALAKEGGRLYTILDVCGGGEPFENYPPYQRFVSRHLVKDPLAGEYLDLQVQKLQKRRNGMIRSKTLEREELVRIDMAIDGITELKKEWELCRR